MWIFVLNMSMLWNSHSLFCFQDVGMDKNSVLRTIIACIAVNWEWRPCTLIRESKYELYCMQHYAQVHQTIEILHVGCLSVFRKGIYITMKNVQEIHSTDSCKRYGYMQDRPNWCRVMQCYFYLSKSMMEQLNHTQLLVMMNSCTLTYNKLYKPIYYLVAVV